MDDLRITAIATLIALLLVIYYVGFSPIRSGDSLLQPLRLFALWRLWALRSYMREAFWRLDSVEDEFWHVSYCIHALRQCCRIFVSFIFYV